MNFAKLWNTVESYVDPVADFLLGEKDYESGDVVGPRSGGFLGDIKDIIGVGAKFYSGEEENPDFAATERRNTKITRYRPRPPSSPGGATPGSQILGASSARFQRVMQRARAGHMYSNSDMNRFGRNVRVAMTVRQGRMTQPLERPTMPSVKEAAPAQVRKHAKDVT